MIEKLENADDGLIMTREELKKYVRTMPDNIILRIRVGKKEEEDERK